MNITIGQYYPTDSVIHKLDARVKIIGTFLYIAAIFIAKGIVGYLLSILMLAAVIQLSRVPVKMLLNGLKAIIVIIVFTVALNIFFTPGERILWQYGVIKISVEGILTAVKLAVRLILLIMGSSILTLSTTPIQLTVGMEYLLKPFKKIGVPAHEIAMMTSIALRFIPNLVEELDKIRKAQMARGADFDTGGLVKKAKSLIPLLVPLFVSAFRRADELAMAMEARCYRGDVNRTRMNEPVLEKSDYTALFIMTAFMLLILAIRLIWGL
ncbi:MAG: energy-coupling factor transporter transmembrane protein EcfT [Firmicutes bacterium]|nr:energy-coupling factor transporter transmembrane protein EcfT [Bacillota bacterium]